MLIHADADAFFASVEERDDPSLRGVPFVVAHQVVACPSYPARALGVRGGVPVGHARRILRDLRLVEPRHEAYETASRDLFALFASVTAFVEPGSMEEAFLDVEAVGLDPVDTARTLRERARAELGLPVSMGVGTTKLMAKVASRRAKPDGMVVIGRREDRTVRHALRLEEVWGVGPATVEALRQQGWRTVGDLAALEVRELSPIVGTTAARRLAAVAAGLDDARVKVPGERRSAGASRTIAPTRSRSVVEGTVQELLAAADGRLPAALEVARIDLALRFDDGVVVERTHQLRSAVRDTDLVGGLLREQLASTGWIDDGRGVTFLGIGLQGRPRTVAEGQLTIF
ncbi:Y-family DNA polymerase [Ornithinimicrobium panacihumi]|uniref:Y-family DNA polymerase n=1 Tax=Ornithinimicrobium panacihumi TaxID=2008449 RepID=UPI003F8B2B01